MKNTMKDIANKYYYIDIVELWDEIAEVFANEHNVDVAEVMEYFL